MASNILILIMGFLVLVIFAIGALSAAPWLPTKAKQRKRLTEIIPIKDNDIIYDLGCGDGSVLFDLSQRNKKIKAIGFEIAILPYFIAIAKKLLGGANTIMSR